MSIDKFIGGYIDIYIYTYICAYSHISSEASIFIFSPARAILTVMCYRYTTERHLELTGRLVPMLRRSPRNANANRPSDTRRDG